MISPAVFIGDPPVREDGRCVVCLGPRNPERSKKYAGDVAHLDPFCSNVCARDWHGLLTHNIKPGPKGRAA